MERGETAFSQKRQSVFAITRAFSARLSEEYVP